MPKVGPGGKWIPPTNDPPKHRGKHVSPQRRIEDELARIQQGVRSGELDPSQAGKLTAAVDKIQVALEKDTSGGAKISASERKDLEGALNKSSARIFDEKQTARVAKLVKEGKLTADQGKTLDADIESWAKGLSTDGDRLGKDWRALQQDIRKDEGPAHVFGTPVQPPKLHNDWVSVKKLPVMGTPVMPHPPIMGTPVVPHRPIMGTRVAPPPISTPD